jgi:16S rRNA (adenine(1408)-N(1))-methyltransferase
VADLVARHERVTIDAGTGDGRAVLAAATREPATLVLGLDANAASMAESSRRAARPARKGGLPNAGFVVAAAEAPPDELLGVASLITVHFPWGSLLRGVIGRDDRVAAGLASLVGPAGALDILVAPLERDGLEGVPTSANALAAGTADAFAEHGFVVERASELTPAEIRATGSTWARRLDRQATLIRLVRR